MRVPVAVQAPARPTPQHRPAHPLPGGQIEGSTHPGRQGDDRHLGPLADHGQSPMASLGAQVLDVGAAGLRHPQAQEAKQAGEGVLHRTGGRGLGQEGALRARGSRTQRPTAIAGLHCHFAQPQRRHAAGQ